jgi:cytochrome c oxidase assembly factor 2
MRRALRLTPAQRRSATTSLFAATALAAVLSVSAAALPCPAHGGRFADADTPAEKTGAPRPAAATVVARRPRRWIEEVHPAADVHTA